MKINPVLFHSKVVFLKMSSLMSSWTSSFLPGRWAEKPGNWAEKPGGSAENFWDHFSNFWNITSAKKT